MASNQWRESLYLVFPSCENESMRYRRLFDDQIIGVGVSKREKTQERTPMPAARNSLPRWQGDKRGESFDQESATTPQGWRMRPLKYIGLRAEFHETRAEASMCVTVYFSFSLALWTTKQHHPTITIATRGAMVIPFLYSV